MAQESSAVNRKHSTPHRGVVLHTTFQEYTLLETIGEGGVGVVWKATDSDGDHVAIKILRPDSSASRTNRFKNELMFCATTKHDHIVRVIDHGVTADGKTPFYVMPLFASSLRKLMSRVADP